MIVFQLIKIFLSILPLVRTLKKKKNTKRFVALKLINPWSDDGKSSKRKFCFFEDFRSLEKVLIQSARGSYFQNLYAF
jgi:hypothetical protein